MPKFADKFSPYMPLLVEERRGGTKDGELSLWWWSKHQWWWCHCGGGAPTVVRPRHRLRSGERPSIAVSWVEIVVQTRQCVIKHPPPLLLLLLRANRSGQRTHQPKPFSASEVATCNQPTKRLVDLFGFMTVSQFFI